MKNIKSKIKASRSKKAPVCHICGNLTTKMTTSKAKSKSGKIARGHFFGPLKWYPEK